MLGEPLRVQRESGEAIGAPSQQPYFAGSGFSRDSGSDFVIERSLAIPMPRPTVTFNIAGVGYMAFESAKEWWIGGWADDVEAAPTTPIACRTGAKHPNQTSPIHLQF